MDPEWIKSFFFLNHLATFPQSLFHDWSVLILCLSVWMSEGISFCSIVPGNVILFSCLSSWEYLSVQKFEGILFHSIVRRSFCSKVWGNIVPFNCLWIFPFKCLRSSVGMICHTPQITINLQLSYLNVFDLLLGSSLFNYLSYENWANHIVLPTDFLSLTSESNCAAEGVVINTAK